MARRSSVNAASGLVQVIQLEWSKASRGGEGARARAKVPSAFEVPATSLDDCGGKLCVEVWEWGDGNAFSRPFEVRRLHAPSQTGFNFGCVSVSAADEAIRVHFLYASAIGGAPDRWHLNWPGADGPAGRTLFVRNGAWVRVLYNGRFTDYDTGRWWYQQVTVNVAWFTDTPDGRIFVDQEPNQSLNAHAILR